MKLLVNELLSERSQGISSDTIAIVEGIRVHLYKHNNPAGELFLQIRDSSGQVVAESERISITAISEAPFFHGQVRFFIKAHLAADTAYQITLCSSGYAFSEAAYIGWCLDFDFQTYPKTEQYAHDYEVWVRK